MTSPYSSNLLQESQDTSSAPNYFPRPMQHTTHVSHVVPATVQMPPHAVMTSPQVIYVNSSQSASAVATFMLGLVVVLVGSLALVGAYFATKDTSPSAREAALTQGVAMRDGFRSGRDRGIQNGLDQAVSNAATISQIRIAAARERAFAAAYRRGIRAGKKYRAPRYTASYGRGYHSQGYSPRYSGGDIVAAFGQAQSLANMTGAPVDIEVY